MKNFRRPPSPKNESKEEPAHVESIADTRSFFLEDFAKSLFPLKTNRYLIQNGEEEIKEYINKCLDQNIDNYRFAPQSRVYAAKSERHLRRTIKLDVVSEYFLYDIIFRNKKLFRKPFSNDRTHYGYRFENGNTINPTLAFKAFKGAISEYGKKYSHTISFDIASYFNNIYHHDIVSWFSELGASDEDAGNLGSFLREIRFGRSIDCLPQGLYPSKMIGNEFLRFIDNYHDLKSDKLIRFMDDFYLFSNDKNALEDDFQTVQRLLGERGLSINPQKTRRDAASHLKTDSEIDKVKSDLLKKRRFLITVGYDEAGNQIVKEHLAKFPLREEEMRYIENILNKSDIEEDDAELILTIMKDHAIRVEKRIPYIIEKYPHLTKNVYTFCAHISDKDALSAAILDEVRSRHQIMEFQLFWFGYILDDYLINTSRALELISALFNHRSATSITRAKILEIQSTKFGLPDLREQYLVSGQSDWLAWSSAVGSCVSKPIARNHRLKYFGNSSNINHLISRIALK